MISEALRLIRVYHDLKQNQMAERLGLSTSYVSEIERGQRVPTLETVEKYARAFDMPASSILFFAENMDDPKGSEKARSFIAGKVLALMRFLEARAAQADA